MTATKRKALTKKARFEVFKRDSFTCQYCGKKAPEVVLHVDHVHPVSKGGSNDILNLVTSCEYCNAGKSDRTLDDSAAVSKRMGQAATLQAKREQIEMISEWQRGLVDLDEISLKEALSYYSTLVPGWSLNETGASKIRRYISKHGLADVMAAFRASAASHVRFDETGKATQESSAIVFRVAENALKYKAYNEKDPVGGALRYIGGIARNRFSWCPVNHRQVITDAHKEFGVPVDRIRELVMECRNWSQFESALAEEPGE
jgi:hypothetical protein